MNTKHTKSNAVTWELGSQLRRIALAIVVLACALAAAPLAHAATLGQSNATSLSSGLVGYWPMDGATTNWLTGITRDLSGSANNGSLVSMSTTTSPMAGKVGQALNFNGSSNYINLGNPSSLNFGTNSFSYSFWFKSNTSVGSLLINKATGGVAAGFDFLVAVGNVAGSVEPRVFDGTLAYATPPWTGTNDNKWHHVTVIVDRVANTLVMYGDGVFRGSQVLTGFGSVTSATNANIGARQGATFYTGGIDDMRIYNRALSASEVKQLYTQGTATVAHSSNIPLSNGLVGYWPFDGNVTNWNTKISSDLSGSNDGATIYLLSTTTSPVGGKIAQALYFNGTAGNYASISSNLPITTAVTISAWVKIPVLPPSGRGGIISDRQGGTGVNIDISNEAACTHGAIEILEAGGTATCGSVVLGLNKWYLITVVLSGTTRQIYINGALDTTTSGAWTWPTVGSAAIGSGNGAASAFYTGVIDDARLYNRALLPSEVKQLYTLGAGTIAQSNPTLTGSGLVGYWTFDGPKINWATGAVSDSSGNANTATVVSMATSSAPAPGKIGQGLKFNGVNNFALIANSTSFQVGNTLTIAVWVKPNNLSARYNVFSNSSNNATGNSYWLEVGGTAGTYTNGVAVAINGTFVSTASNVLTPNVWNYVVYTRSGTGAGTHAIYVNGQKVTLNTTGSNWNDAPNFIDNSDPKIIGARPGPSQFFPGTIDDLRIYNRVLSPAEITQLYNSSR